MVDINKNIISGGQRIDMDDFKSQRSKNFGGVSARQQSFFAKDDKEWNVQGARREEVSKGVKKDVFQPKRQNSRNLELQNSSSLNPLELQTLSKGLNRQITDTNSKLVQNVVINRNKNINVTNTNIFLEDHTIDYN